MRPRLPDVPLAAAARKTLSPQEAAKMVERLRNLCLTKGQDITGLEETAKALRESGYKQELSQIFREAIWWPEAHPHVGALWMRRLLSSNNWDRSYPQTMDQLCRRGEIGRRAVIEFLETVLSKNRTALVRQAVRKHGRWLHKDPVGWGAAAGALVAVRLYRPAARWVANWRDRPELGVSLLLCVAQAFRGVGREGQARQIVEFALGKGAGDQRFSILHLYEAQEKAFAGDLAGANAHFKQIQPEGWDDDSLVLYYLVRGVIRVQRAEKGSQVDAYEAAYNRVGDQLGRRRIYKCDVALRRQYRRCFWQMGRDSGKTGSSLLAFWRSADSWITVVPLLLIPGLQLLLPLYLVRLCTNRRGRRSKRG